MSSHDHDVEEQPRNYALTLRTPIYAGWQPLFGLFIAVFSFVFLLSVAVTADQETVTWHGLLVLNLAIASLVLVTIGIMRAIHAVPGSWLASVAPGIRWRFLRACLGIALAVIVVQLLLDVALPGDASGLTGTPNELTGTLVGLAAVVLLTTPLQALGEEYLFRGYLMQAFGALTRHPWIAVVLTSLLFAVAHGSQNWPLFLNRLSFGLAAGILVVRTGGLEAGIALHIWNNIFAFGLALGLGNIDDTLQVGDTSWWVFWVALLQNGSYLVLVLWIANRMGITRETSRPVLPPVSAPV